MKEMLTDWLLLHECQTLLSFFFSFSSERNQQVRLIVLLSVKCPLPLERSLAKLLLSRSCREGGGAQFLMIIRKTKEIQNCSLSTLAMELRLL